MGKKTGWFKYTTNNPFKGMGWMKHNFRLIMKNDQNVTIYDDYKYNRTHTWEFVIPKEKLNLIDSGKELTITLKRKDRQFFSNDVRKRFGDATVSADKMISEKGEETKLLLADKKRAML